MGVFGRDYGESEFRSTERSGLRSLSVAMSTSSGQEIVCQIVQDEAQLMPMDVNGADQSVTEAAAQSRGAGRGEQYCRAIHQSDCQSEPGA